MLCHKSLIVPLRFYVRMRFSYVARHPSLSFRYDVT